MSLHPDFRLTRAGFRPEALLKVRTVPPSEILPYSAGFLSSSLHSSLHSPLPRRNISYKNPQTGKMPLLPGSRLCIRRSHLPYVCRPQPRLPSAHRNSFRSAMQPRDRSRSLGSKRSPCASPVRKYRPQPQAVPGDSLSFPAADAPGSVPFLPHGQRSLSCIHRTAYPGSFPAELSTASPAFFF